MALCLRFTAGNLLVTQQSSYLIDWEFATVGPMAYDIGSIMGAHGRMCSTCFAALYWRLGRVMSFVCIACMSACPLMADAEADGPGNVAGCGCAQATCCSLSLPRSAGRAVAATSSVRGCWPPCSQCGTAYAAACWSGMPVHGYVRLEW
jgi:hypothetical protein